MKKLVAQVSSPVPGLAALLVGGAHPAGEMVGGAHPTEEMVGSAHPTGEMVGGAHPTEKPALVGGAHSIGNSPHLCRV